MFVAAGNDRTAASYENRARRVPTTEATVTTAIWPLSCLVNNVEGAHSSCVFDVHVAVPHMFVTDSVAAIRVEIVAVASYVPKFMPRRLSETDAHTATLDGWCAVGAGASNEKSALVEVPTSAAIVSFAVRDPVVSGPVGWL